jgi:DNA invertase Pin-like site-specific DNA recombinase
MWKQNPSLREEHVKNAAVYARVSTTDRGQTNDNQLQALRAWGDRLGVEVVGEYVDEASGARGDRPGLRALLDAAARRRTNTRRRGGQPDRG